MPETIRVLLWLFVFTTPWDAVSLPVIGSLSRAVGLVALAAGVLGTILRGRIRRLDWVFLCAIALGVWSAMSLLWTNSFDATLTMAFSYAQLVVLVAIVREFVRTPAQQESLLGAFLLGCFVPMAGLLYNYQANVQITMADRFSATRINADDLGLTLVIGIPIAWHIIRHRRGISRAVAMVYFILAPLATLLTATRGAFVAGLVAFSIVPLTANARLSVTSMARAALLLVIVGAAATAVVPETSWQRIGSIATELLEGGQLTGRRDIWSAGLEVFPTHPYIGFGAGSYGRATQNLLNTDITAGHNFFLTLAVELGLVGLFVAGSLLVATAVAIVRMPSSERILWGIVMLTWLVGVMSVNWEIRKTTWLLFGFVAAHGTFQLRRRYTVPSDVHRGLVSTTPSLSGRLPSADWAERQRPVGLVRRSR
jgi:O-antigen ligase